LAASVVADALLRRRSPLGHKCLPDPAKGPEHIRVESSRERRPRKSVGEFEWVARIRHLVVSVGNDGRPM